MAKKWLTPIDLSQNELRNAAIQQLASDPGSPVEGQLWVQTTAHDVRIRNNGATVSLLPTSLLASANTWTANQTFNTSILGNGTIALTGAGASSVGGSFSATIHIATGITGATAASRYVGATAAGSPSSGTFVTGDFVIAQNGHLFICTAGGSPGTWADVTAGLTPASSVVADQTFGAGTVVGTSTNYARQDHSHGSPTHVGTDHAAISLSALSAPTADLSIGSHKLTNVTDPTSAQDAATKAYVDTVSQGITSIKNPVRVATTANGTLATAYANGQVVDGVTLATGDRILLKNQTTASENGIYTVNAAGAPTRATDADGSGELALGTLVFVNAGTSNGGQQWIISAVSATPWVPGSSTTTWTMYFAATATQAGSGLSATGNVFNVGAGTGISVAADTVAVDTTVVARKFSQQIGNGALTTIAVTHNLGNQWVNAQIFSTSSPFDEQECDIQLTDANTVTLLFSVAPATNALRVVVTG